ncbi:MAG: aspartate aminotransferase family protein, partial [Acidimicrobiaceae bacterium]|nr:aspartate aminotransferase family protein [Acidimicrobiaceae bacterium]
ALNTSAFPSLGEIQSELCGWTADLLHGPPETAGFLTSGGTESILCAVEAARERARAERSITEPEIVLAVSAHAAFHKGAHLFGLRTRVVPVTDAWTVDLDAMADAVGPNTALVVASAPQYPQGVVDPVAEIAEIAAGVGASCHVDACMGGFVLPFATLEEPEAWGSASWDLAVDGVTTISADLHKLGYAPKGASVILHRSRHLRRYQTFDFDGWLGGRYVTPNLQGTRSGLPMAAAWAVVRHLGMDGYRRLVRSAIGSADRIRNGVRAIDGITVPGDPRHHLLSIVADTSVDEPLNVFALGDALATRGWHHDRQGPPDGLHLTVSAGNAPVVDQWLEDLVAAAAEARAASPGTATDYATLE